MRKKLEAAVLQAMSSAEKSEMVWGVDDCAMWVASIIRETLGYDPAERFREKYKTRDTAHQELGTLGLGFAIRQSAKQFGWKRILPEFAEAGDIGSMMLDKIPVTVICRKRGWFIGRNETACTLVPSSRVRIAWSVI